MDKLNKVSESRTKYSKTHNVNYDYVVHIRFDAMYVCVIDSSIDYNNYINGHLDMCLISSSANINKMSNFF